MIEQIINSLGITSLILGVVLVFLLFWQHGEILVNWVLDLTIAGLTKVIGIVFAAVLVLFITGRLAQWWESYDESKRLLEQRQVDQGSQRPR